MSEKLDTIDTARAARLFLLARGREDPSGDDFGALQRLLYEFALSGYKAGLEKAKADYRDVHSGQLITS